MSYVQSDWWKSHDRAGSFTGSQGCRARPVQWSRGIFTPLGPVGFIPLGAPLCGSYSQSLFLISRGGPWPLVLGVLGCLTREELRLL